MRDIDYISSFRNNGGKKSKVGTMGVTRGYGYMLLAQTLKVELMELGLISSRHMDECMEVLTGFGYRKEDIIIYGNKKQVQSASGHGAFIVSDYRLVLESDIMVSVECTGNTAVSSEVPADTLKKGINVYIVSKETDSVCGPILNNIAEKHGTVYSLVNGDQPGSPLDPYSWGRVLGLEIIAAGKANEYDSVWDPDTDEFIYVEGPEKPHENIPGLKKFWHYEGPGTLEGRRKLLERYMAVISANLREMNLVSNVTGLVLFDRHLNYPVAKISELADIFISEEDGGILKKTGVVDVSYNLRASDEASSAGGEFVVIRRENEMVWELLTSKGYVASRNGKYTYTYPPYYYIGLKTPIFILLGDILGLGTHPECRQVSTITGAVQKDMPKGTVLEVQGHHHSIEGLVPELWELKDMGNVAPLYLLNGTILLEDVKAGQPIAKGVVDLSESLPYELYNEGSEL